MATGQLMFEVGIKSAQEQLDKIKQEFTKANGDLQKLLNLKVSIDGVDAVTKALNQIGDTTALRNLRNEIAALNREFSILSKGAGGSGDIAGRGLAADIERTSQSIERYTSKIKQLTEERTRLVGGTRNSSYQIFTDKILSYELSLEGARKKLAELNEQKNKPIASEPLKKATQDAQTFETALGRIETAIGGLKSGMSVNLTGDFSKWAQEVQSVTASVRELVEQLQKMHNASTTALQATQQLSQAENKPTSNGSIFDPQKFNTLQEAIDKIISEINRLQQAFTHLGENSSLSNLSTMINGLAVTLSSLSNAIKIQPLDEQVKALLERCEKAEAKLREVGDAAKYLNERAGAKTQQKAGTIMGITGTEEEQLNKVSSTAERFMRLLVEIENQMAKIGKIQALGEQSGFSPTLLKNAQTQLDALKKAVESTIKVTPIAEGLVVPASASQLAQFIQQFGLLKAQYKDVITEADRFNKATEKGSSQAESRIRKLGMAFNDLKGYMKANGGSEEMKRLQSEIQGAIQKMRQLMNAGNFAGAVNVYERMAGSIRQAATATKEYERSVMGAASANSLLTSSEHQLANALKNSSDSMRGQSQVLSDLKMMATQYLGVWGAQGFLRNVIEIGGQLEMQRLSIGAILGDMAKANELFDRIKNLAVKSPFGVVELDQMTKQLSAYGFEYNELFDMTKRLADISAATGTSVDRLALALGHVRSEAALSGYTLRQFSMANIPLAKKLSEELTKVEGKFVSVADVRKRVRTKDIGYEQVLKVLKDLTDEGGMFYNAQEIMSESVKARFKNLKDSMDIMYGEIAESSVGDALKDVASLLTTLTRHWQELGAVLVAGAGYWTVNRIAMMAMSKAAVTNNIVTGQFTAKQLEAQAVTGNLTKQQLLRAVASRKMAVADAEAAANVLGLTTAQLQLVRRTGDVSRAMTMATVATSKYSIAQLRFMAMFRSFSLFNLKDLFLGIASGAKAAGVAVLGLVKSFWPMLALSAVAEVFMSMKREAESFADAANYVGQSARNLMKDIDETISSISKAGKPIDADALRESVKTMKEVLEQSEYYTAEQQNQVDNAKTLSEKYDVLLKQLKEMREEAEWQTNNEGLIEKILSNTGKGVQTSIGQRLNRETGQYEAYESQSFGLPFFNNSLQENIEQVNKSNASLQSAINLLSEYQGVMNEAIKKNNGFGLSLEGKSWQEQIRLIAQSGHWDEFVSSVENAGSRFEKTASKVKDASDKVRDDWQHIVDDDVKAIRLTLMEEWGMTEDDINQFAKNNERTMRWLVDSIAKSLSKLGVAEQIIDEFKRKLLELFGVASGGKPNKKEPTVYDLQTGLGKQIMSNVIRHNKNNGRGGNGVLTVKEVNELTGTGEHEKTESEVVKAIKERAQKDYQTMKDVGKIYGETSKKYLDAKKKYERSLNIAESNRISTDEILTGKYKDKKDKKTTDEDARVLRERVRILKEAADSYQYWRDKVGESQAEAHMQDEFGTLLQEQKLQLKNADELKAKLQELRAEYSKKPQTKAMVEAIKEIDKELAQLERKDFERDTERFLSQTKLQLDSLTRAWDTFNSVREATGNIELAKQLSGVTYDEDNLRNLAEATRSKIEADFAAAGAVTIPLSIDLSDKQIEDKVHKAFADAAPKREDFEDTEKGLEAYNRALMQHESQIKGVIEETKKWRDLQRDLYKDDISVFTKAWNDDRDRYQQFTKAVARYDEEKQSLERLLDQWNSGEVDEYGNRKGISQAQFDRAFANLTSRESWAKFKAQTGMDWITSNIDKTSIVTVRRMIVALKEYAATTQMSAEETEAWFKALNQFTDREAIISPIQGVTQAIENYNRAAERRIAAEASYKNTKANENATSQQIAEASQEYDEAVAEEIAAFNSLKKAINVLSSKFTKFGSDLQSFGQQLGGTVGDIFGGFGQIFSSVGNGMNAIQNIDFGATGIFKVMGYAQTAMTLASSMIGVFQGIESMIPSTDQLYEKYAAKQKKVNQMREAVDNYRIAVARARAEEEGWIGGGDALDNLRKAYDVHGEVVLAYYSKLQEAQEQYVESSAGIKKAIIPMIAAITAVAAVAAGVFSGGTGTVALWGLGTMAMNALGASAIAATLSATTIAAIGAAVAATAGAVVGKAVQSGIDAITYKEGQIDARRNMRVQTQHHTFFRSEKTQNLEEWAKENLGVDLFDKAGLIDLKAAQAVLDSGATLVGETKETLEKLMELREQYDEWEKSIRDYISDRFSGIADDMTNAIWDWLTDGENALDKFHDYASDTFKQIAQDAVKSFLKVTVLDSFQEQLENMYKAYSMKDKNGNRVLSEAGLMAGVASVAGEMAAAFEATLPAAENLATIIKDAFEFQGYDITNKESSSSASSQISKSITEEQGNLVVAYLNAMRADLSVVRELDAKTVQEYWPSQIRLMTAGTQSLANIESHTSAIMRSSDAIERSNQAILDNINGLKSKTWSVPIA